MIRKRSLFILFFIASIAISNSEHKSRGLFNSLKDLFKSPIRWYRNDYVAKDKTSATDLATLKEQKRRNNLQAGEPPLEGSIAPVEGNVKFPYSLLNKNFFLNAGPRQYNSISCSCNPFGLNDNCLTICTSSGVSCGQTCTNSVIYTASSTVDALGAFSARTTSFFFTGDCDRLSIICSASSAISSVSVSGRAATTSAILFAGGMAAIALGVGLGVPAIVESPPPVTSNFDAVIEPVISQTPENNLNVPAVGSDFPDDVCESSSVQFNNQCTSLLRRGPCASIFQWVTLDEATLQGRCTPRLCGRRKVFVGRDGLCHDIHDPNECRGGRRLYYSAFGDPLCDCPIGQFPFPTGTNNCVSLFTQGPCPAGMIVSLSDDDTLACAPSQCPSLNSPSGQPFQMFPFGNGQCFALGTRGPCPASHLLGYDVFDREAVCVNMEDPSSPYFSSPEEDEILDRFYNQGSAEFNNVDGVFQQNALGRNDTVERRQGSGVFQLPTQFPDSLLNPCRPGDRGGFNHKCSNPLVPNYGIGTSVQQPVQSPYRCQSNHFLQATGQCSNDNRGSSCGPSHRYNSNTGQCRPIF